MNRDYQLCTYADLERLKGAEVRKRYEDIMVENGFNFSHPEKVHSFMVPARQNLMQKVGGVLSTTFAFATFSKQKSKAPTLVEYSRTGYQDYQYGDKPVVMEQVERLCEFMAYEKARDPDGYQKKKDMYAYEQLQKGNSNYDEGKLDFANDIDDGTGYSRGTEYFQDQPYESWPHYWAYRTAEILYENGQMGPDQGGGGCGGPSPSGFGEWDWPMN